MKRIFDFVPSRGAPQLFGESVGLSTPGLRGDDNRPLFIIRRYRSFQGKRESSQKSEMDERLAQNAPER